LPQPLFFLVRFGPGSPYRCRSISRRMSASVISWWP
jgi:hypothetical protein